MSRSSDCQVTLSLTETIFYSYNLNNDPVVDRVFGYLTFLHGGNENLPYEQTEIFLKQNDRNPH